MTRQQTLAEVDRLLTIMETLRGPDGCPWDARQTPQSLRSYLLEETHELLEALDRDDTPAVRDELGDVLLQIVFHSAIYAEQGAFSFGEVAQRIADKLERRHPHVFVTEHHVRHEDHSVQWELIKAMESPRPGRRSVDDSIPITLPALQRAVKISERLSRQSYPFPSTDERQREVKRLMERLALCPDGESNAAARGDIGRMLLLLVWFARDLSVDPESALRETLIGLLAGLDAPDGLPAPGNITAK